MVELKRTAALNDYFGGLTSDRPTLSYTIVGQIKESWNRAHGNVRAMTGVLARV
jgi:hypothetical protein